MRKQRRFIRAGDHYLKLGLQATNGLNLILSTLALLTIGPAAAFSAPEELENERDVLFLEGKGLVRCMLSGILRYEANVNVVIVEDGRFAMTMDNHILYPDRRVEFKYDGEDYTYIIYPTEDNHGLARLSSGDIPYISIQDPIRDGLWYLLGAGQFIEKNAYSGEMVNLFLNPRRRIQAHGFRYEVEHLTDRFLFPRGLEVIKDKSLDMPSRQEEETRFQLDLRHVGTEDRETQWEFKRGWIDEKVAVRVEWDDEKRLDGEVIVPGAFAVREYSGWEENPRWEIEGEWEQWRAAESREDVDFQPSSDTDYAVRVQDSRLRDRDDTNYVDYVYYVVGGTDGNPLWPGKDEYFVQQLFTTTMENQSIPTVTSTNDTIWGGTKRATWVTVLLLAAIFPLGIVVIIWYYKTRRARNV